MCGRIKPFLLAPFNLLACNYLKCTNFEKLHAHLKLKLVS